ncbi:MAG: BREX-1 system adenine-specific DNA-methyltransferase PglX, partial [bacterium]
MHPDSHLAEKMRYFVPNPYNDNESIPLKPVHEITLLDPACGTMHFGLVAFDLFYEMYLEELHNAANDGWPAEPSVANEADIPAAILEHNIYGIDIDLRAIQLSALTLYLKAQSLNNDLHIHKLNLTYTDIPCISEKDQQTFIDSLHLEHSITKELLVKIIPELNKAYYLGSLLKIEETVEKFIDEKRNEIKKLPPILQELETGKTSDFWEQMREDILQGLRQVVEMQTNGQRLIAGEAIQGLGLIDGLMKQYDVVVANPPYSGRRNWSESLRDGLKLLYPKKDGDLYTCFIDRAYSLTIDNGFSGLVTIHSFMFTSSHEKLRNLLINSTELETMVHLGTRTEFDIANKTAQGFNVFTFGKIKNINKANPKGVYFRMVQENEENKHTAFKTALNDWQINRENARDGHLLVMKQNDFKAIPGWPLVYWVTDKIRSIFLSNDSLEKFAPPRQGITTADNFRFLRYWWEVNEVFWRKYMKGGGFNKWFGNQEFVVKWKNDGEEIKNFYKNGKLASSMRNLAHFFNEGITYSEMTSKFCARYLPEGFAFDVKGSCVFPAESIFVYLGIMNSLIINYFTKILNPTVSTQVGDVARLPSPNLNDNTKFKNLISQQASSSIHLKHYVEQMDTISHEFILPTNWKEHIVENLFLYRNLVLFESDISKYAYQIYQISNEDILLIESEFGTLPTRMTKLDFSTRNESDEFQVATNLIRTYFIEKHIPEKVLKQSDEAIEDNDTETISKSRRQARYLTFEEVCLASGYHPDTVYEIIKQNKWERPEERFELALNWLEYAMGVLMGRFKPGQKSEQGCAIIHKNDFITGSLTITDDEFEDITQYFEANYIDAQGKHFFSSQQEQQLCQMADPDGIMVLDQGHSDDLPAQIEDVLITMLGEKQAQEILATLIGDTAPNKERFRNFMERDFFVKHHVKMYRKRPIYWLLQTANKSYGFYVFHERFDSDTLFKLQRNYIDPKLNLIDQQIR